MKGSKFKAKESRAGCAAAPAHKRLHARIEDRRDVEAAKKALAECGERISYEKVRGELGL